MPKDLIIRSSAEEFITFKVQEKDKGIHVKYEKENLWMTQKAMAELFDCSTDNISLHLKNIFNENELDKNSVTEEFSATASDGKKYNMKFYNLDAIISVGYRVNSLRATQFRRWATKLNFLKKYKIKCTMQYPIKLLLRLFMKELIRKKNIWDLHLGEIRLMVK